MKKLTFIILGVFSLGLNFFAQEQYRASDEDPFGKPHPNAPQQVKNYSKLKGISDCKSSQRGRDGKFKDPEDSVWQFKYIMNGRAVQDESWKSDGNHTTSVRQFDPKKSQWYVTFFSANSPTATPSTWTGGTEKSGNIVLKRDQKAPNGMEGVSRLTFYEISDRGFKWKGEWVSKNGKIVYPFWRIECEKRKKISLRIKN